MFIAPAGVDLVLLTADARLPVQLAVALVHDPIRAAHLPPPPPPAVMVMAALTRRVASGGARGRADALGCARGQHAALAAGAALDVAAQRHGVKHLEITCPSDDAILTIRSMCCDLR